MKRQSRSLSGAPQDLISEKNCVMIQTCVCLKDFSAGENLPVCQKMDKALDRKYYTASSHIIDNFQKPMTETL